MAKRSVAEDRDGANYLFYETRDGFHFRSLESLSESESVGNYKRKPANTTTGNPDEEQYKNVNKIDILINNAGGPPSGNFDKFSVEDFQAAFELNCLSAMRITKEVLPFMKKQKSGRIINCVSAGIKVTNSTLVLLKSPIQIFSQRPMQAPKFG